MTIYLIPGTCGRLGAGILENELWSVFKLKDTEMKRPQRISRCQIPKKTQGHEHVVTTF